MHLFGPLIDAVARYDTEWHSVSFSGGLVPVYSLTGPTLWIELALNALYAPFLFALLKRFGGLLAERSGR
jgi:hypothetical protein